MIVTTRKEFDKSLRILKKQDKVVIDVETEGLDIWREHKVCGIGVSMENGKGFYYPVRHKYQELPLLLLLTEMQEDDLNIPLEWVTDELFPVLNNIPLLIGHNIKFDLAALLQDGFDLAENQQVNDTMIGGRLFVHACALPQDRSLSLDNLSNKILGGQPWKKEFREYLKSRGIGKRFDLGEPHVVGEYCINDCVNTFDLWKFFIKHVDTTGQRKVWDNEQTLIRECLWEMEKYGIYFDMDYVNSRLPMMREKVESIQEQIWEMAGYTFDISSMQQLTEMFKKFGIESTSETKSGNPKWDMGELLLIEHPIGGLISEYRVLQKVIGTYFEKLPQWKDSIIHPQFKPWEAVTGRMSCENPNMQNQSAGIIDLQDGDDLDEATREAITARLNVNKMGDPAKEHGAHAQTATLSLFTSLGKKYNEHNPNLVAVRRLFLARPGYRMFFFDFSQMEMRIFADYVNDPGLSALLSAADFDFHSHVAKEVWKAEEGSTMFKFYRTLAKQINFGLIYNIGVAKLANGIQKSVEEARKYKADYFARFPKALIFMNGVIKMAKSRGWVRNKIGRRYYLDEDSDYRGVNYLIQGSSADIVKARMIACQRFLKENKFKSKMVLQVHDEIDFEVHESETFIVRDLKRIMEDNSEILKTYLPVDVEAGCPSMVQKYPFCLDCLKVIAPRAKEGEPDLRFLIPDREVCECD